MKEAMINEDLQKEIHLSISAATRKFLTEPADERSGWFIAKSILLLALAVLEASNKLPDGDIWIKNVIPREKS